MPRIFRSKQFHRGTNFTFALLVKQKVCNEAENRQRDWGETLKIRVFFSRLTRLVRVRLLCHALPISLLILMKKPTVLQSIFWQGLHYIELYQRTLFYRGSLNHCILYVKQWNCALWTPNRHIYNGQFLLSRRNVLIFSVKLTHLIQTPVNTDNRYFSVSQVTYSHILTTSLYGHLLSVSILTPFHCSQPHALIASC